MGKGLGLTRRTGDSVYIGEDIVVTVDSVSGGEVKLTIKAPPDVAINRDAAYVGLKIAASRKKTKGA